MKLTDWSVLTDSTVLTDRSVSLYRFLVVKSSRASLLTAIRAVLLVILLHMGVGVSWALLLATAGLALFTAISFAAFH